MKNENGLIMEEVSVTQWKIQFVANTRTMKM